MPLLFPLHRLPAPQGPSLTSICPLFAANGGRLREWLSSRVMVLEDNIQFIDIKILNLTSAAIIVKSQPGLAVFFDNRIIIIYITALESLCY